MHDNRWPQQDRLSPRGAATFQDANGEIAIARFEAKAQRGRRRFAGDLRRPEQNGEHRIACGRKLQPPQFRILAAARPCEHRAARIRAQRLLRCPQCFARRARAHDEEPRKTDTRRSERRRVGQMWRCDPHQHPSFTRERGERRAEYAQFADAFVLRQDFSKRRGRPAAPRQFRVELRETARHARTRDIT